MKIYSVDVDANNTQYIIPRIAEEISILELLTFDCIEKGDELRDLEWYIFNPKKKAKNFYTGIVGALVFDQTVYDSDLFSLFEMAGEILPIKLENGDTLYVLNVLECVNLLNHNKTIWDIYENGKKGRILQYSFNEEVSESSLFKIPETSRGDILTYSGVKDSSDEFYSLYKKLGFTGLEFKEIYPLHA